jgi:hypothetical protein
VATPSAGLPLRLVDPLFVAIGGGLLAWVLTRKRLDNPQLLVFVSVPYLFSIWTSQWSPLLTAAALIPSAGFCLTCKPTIGAALFAAVPTRRALVSAGLLLLASLLVWPAWPREWIAQLPAAAHAQAPVVVPGGVLILLALLRWRRPEARLLVALSLVPQTLLSYEIVPLFLLVTTWREASILWLLSLAAYTLHRAHGAYPSFDAYFAGSAQWFVWLVYLPATALVLSRPNVNRSGLSYEVEGEG